MLAAGKDPAPSSRALMAAVISPASRRQGMQRGDLETGVWSRPIGNSFRLPEQVLPRSYAGTQKGRQDPRTLPSASGGPSRRVNYMWSGPWRCRSHSVPAASRPSPPARRRRSPVIPAGLLCCGCWRRALPGWRCGGSPRPPCGQAGTGGRTPGKRLLSLAFGVFCGVVRAGVVSFILGTGGRKPSGNTPADDVHRHRGCVE